MATLINLVLIESKEDKKGKPIFRRLDTKEIVAQERVDVLNEPPIALKFEYNKPFPGHFSIKIEDYKMGADALLLGAEIKKSDAVYYSAFFCRIKKNKQ